MKIRIKITIATLPHSVSDESTRGEESRVNWLQITQPWKTLEEYETNDIWISNQAKNIIFSIAAFPNQTMISIIADDH